MTQWWKIIHSRCKLFNDDHDSHSWGNDKRESKGNNVCHQIQHYTEPIPNSLSRGYVGVLKLFFFIVISSRSIYVPLLDSASQIERGWVVVPTESQFGLRTKTWIYFQGLAGFLHRRAHGKLNTFIIDSTNVIKLKELISHTIRYILTVPLNQSRKQWKSSLERYVSRAWDYIQHSIEKTDSTGLNRVLIRYQSY